MADQEVACLGSLSDKYFLAEQRAYEKVRSGSFRGDEIHLMRVPKGVFFELWGYLPIICWFQTMSTRLLCATGDCPNVHFHGESFWAAQLAFFDRYARGPMVTCSSPHTSQVRSLYLKRENLSTKDCPHGDTRPRMSKN